MLYQNPIPGLAAEPVLAYLRLRRRVVGRQLLELGWWRLLLIGSLLLALVSNALFRAAHHPAACWLVPVGVAGVVWSLHRQRPDIGFLQASGPDFRLGLAAEYALLALPVGLALLGLGRPAAALLTGLLPPFVALAPARQAGPATRQRPRSFFRSEAFEWVSGVRSFYGGALWLALLAAALWQHHRPLGAELALAGWLLLVVAFYGTPEPATMLLLSARRPAAFLRRRLGLALGYFALTAAPFGWLLASSAAGPGAAASVAVLLLVLSGLLVLIKYAFYPNALLIRLSQSIVVAVVLTQFANPVFLPVMAALLLGAVWQSQRRLSRFHRE